MQTTYRALDSIQLLLTAISATEQADEVERHKMELLRTSFDEQARNVTRRNASQLVDGQPVRGLLPWREVMTPHQMSLLEPIRSPNLPQTYLRSIVGLHLVNMVIHTPSFNVPT